MNAAAVKRLVAPRAGAWWIPLAGMACGACGTNLQAAYEGDVRFEHCMALDARPEVRGEIRRACWGEWVSFYTYGQTRDRLVHAFQRMRELGGASAAPNGEVADLATEPAGASSEANGERHGCEAECRSVLDACSDGCDNRACRTACTAGYRSCSRKCR